MEEASRGGDRGRLQEAIKGGVTWLSSNGSNPDVAPNSAQVLLCLICFASEGVIFFHHDISTLLQLR